MSLDAFAGGFFRQVLHPVFHQEVVGPKLRGTPTDAAIVDAALTRAAPEAFAYWETLAGGEFLVGARLSLADLAVMSNLLTLRYLGHGPDSARFPKLHAYFQRQLATPLWRATLEAEKSFVDELGLDRPFAA